jgi:hypothetical protein
MLIFLYINYYIIYVKVKQRIVKGQCYNILENGNCLQLKMITLTFIMILYFTNAPLLVV